MQRLKRAGLLDTMLSPFHPGQRAPRRAPRWAAKSQRRIPPLPSPAVIDLDAMNHHSHGMSRDHVSTEFLAGPRDGPQEPGRPLACWLACVLRADDALPLAASGLYAVSKK